MARVKRVGYVYFVQDANDETAPIKIGWSMNPWARLLELRAGNWRELRIIGRIPIREGDPRFGTGYGGLERQLHERFASSRIRFEWFRPHPELLAIAREAARAEAA